MGESQHRNISIGIQIPSVREKVRGPHTDWNCYQSDFIRDFGK